MKSLLLGLKKERDIIFSIVSIRHFVNIFENSLVFVNKRITVVCTFYKRSPSATNGNLRYVNIPHDSTCVGELLNNCLLYQFDYFTLLRRYKFSWSAVMLPRFFNKQVCKFNHIRYCVSVVIKIFRKIVFPT